MQFLTKKQRNKQTKMPYAFDRYLGIWECPLDDCHNLIILFFPKS